VEDLSDQNDRGCHSRFSARFVRIDSAAQNMAVLEAYLRRFGRPLKFYTDKASIFVTTPKRNHPECDADYPPCAPQEQTPFPLPTS
jgi:hypothetical protein